jgi:pilus assembly protein Flp/PilA
LPAGTTRWRRFHQNGEVASSLLDQYQGPGAFHVDKRGQGLVEYALILVLVAIVVIGVLGLMGNQINAVFQDVVNTLQGG